MRRKKVPRLFSLIALIMMIAPSIAPSVGTLILTLLNWHLLSSKYPFVTPVYAFFSSNRYKLTEAPKLMSYSEVFGKGPVFGYLLALAFGFSVI